MTTANDGDLEDDEPAPESFADRMRDARPLSKGRERVPLATSGAGARSTRSKSSVQDEHAKQNPFRFPDAAQPNLAARAGVNDRTLRRLAAGEPVPEERIDLHGMRQEAARAALEKRFTSARSRGLRCTLVVHGYGRRRDHGATQATGSASVLKDRLPEWITRTRLGRHVLAFAPAPGALGGSGATLVLLAKTVAKTEGPDRTRDPI